MATAHRAMNLWEIIVRILLVCLIGVVLGVSLFVCIEGAHYVLRQSRRCCWNVRKWCRYKRATVVALAVATETSDPVTWTVVDVQTVPVSCESHE